MFLLDMKNGGHEWASDDALLLMFGWKFVLVPFLVEG